VPSDGTRLEPGALFDKPVKATWLEIGFGGGEHLVHQAAHNPEVGVIGIEPFVNGVSTALRSISDHDLTNVRIFDEDARLLLPHIAPQSFDRVFILFPDPWPKVRHWNRRIFNTRLLDTLAKLMKNGADLRFASDHRGYAQWALRHVHHHPLFEWTAETPADWRNRPVDSIETRYEAKGHKKGDAPVFLSFRRVFRSGPEGA